MKNICLAFLLLLALSNCQKDAASINPQATALTGDWVWIATSGGFTGGLTYKPATNEEIILRIKAGNQFDVLRNGTALYSGTYTTGTMRSIYTGKDTPSIQTQLQQPYPSGSPQLITNGVISSLRTTGMEIDDNAYDGFGCSYRRK
ncbi:hypothetical protein [Fibrella aquatilis]|uniref:Lipocalin-like domain-containing protein n=1 Tax=Fibrella aquatilis TaxID=2817059 RepID=A0A939K3V3_9BACT|nr:hypothetical protein [Fibrella aquatilis]MBO0934735.1 hypothetical protein [Fibrella aquatilis]